MKKEHIEKLTNSFQQAVQEMEGVECWLARDLQELLGYDRWENFLKVIEKAKSSCQKSGHILKDHFRDVTKMVLVGSETQREVQDMALTRYACYLIAQNGDPRKEPIAFAQTYFALQTRKQELLQERLKLVERLNARKKLTEAEKDLSAVLYQRGVDDLGFGRIRSKGDEALFGGFNTVEMKRKLGVSEQRPLADFLPTVTVKAKELASEMTNFNVKKENLHGENSITEEHVNNNRNVRRALAGSNIYPEELPPAEDIRKLERRIKNEDGVALKTSSKFPKKLSSE